MERTTPKETVTKPTWAMPVTTTTQRTSTPLHVTSRQHTLLPPELTPEINRLKVTESITPFLPPSRRTILPPASAVRRPDLRRSDVFNQSQIIPLMANEPSFDDLSTAHLPPDSQLVTPIIPTRKSMKATKLPPARVEAAKVRKMDDFIHTVVHWNAHWLSEQGKLYDCKVAVVLVLLYR